MRLPGKIALAVLVGAAFFVLRLALVGAASAFPATVDKCVDGDTLILDTGERVRLAGIDTPEKGSGKTPAQYYAREAHRFAARLTQGKRVNVLPLSGASRDRHKRLVAEIILPDGRSLTAISRKSSSGVFRRHNAPRSTNGRAAGKKSCPAAKRASPISATAKASVSFPLPVCGKRPSAPKGNAALMILKRRFARDTPRRGNATSGPPRRETSKGLPCPSAKV